MSFPMQRISIDPADLKKDDFEVIVIGSGYGGSIAAAHLAEKATSLCLLERGREILPGEYPRNIEDVANETNIVTGTNGALTPDQNGMMQLRVNEDVHVVLGNGLGGGSLINAGVALEPDARVFDHHWPDSLAKGKVLEPFYKTAKTMLGSTPLPDEFHPNKLKALEVSAREMGQPVERPPINVTFKDGKNAAGVWQAACNHCGDCCSGCNYGAKNTLLMNYLPEAHRRGATIVTGAQVRTIRLCDDNRYEVTFKSTTPSDSPDRVLKADIVIVSAGSIGTTEILQRSVSQTGLPLPKEALGTRFSGNGDVLGFGFMANWTHSNDPYDARNPAPIYGIGAGENTPDQPKYQPGPCITGVIKVNMDEDIDLSLSLVIEEGVAPGPLAAVYPGAFFFDDVLEGSDTIFPDMAGKMSSLAALAGEMQKVRSIDDMAALSYEGAIARSQSFLVMSHDNSGGALVYNHVHDVTIVDWPEAGSKQPYPRDNDVLEKASDGIWATYLPNPLWSEALNRNLVTVHPVGGCPMADSPETGVVDDLCRAWTGTGTEKHPGLFICDGSVIPTSLGLNPLLTISAISERAMDHLKAHHAWAGQAPKPADQPLNASPPFKSAEPEITGKVIAALQEVFDKLLELRVQASKIGASARLGVAVERLLSALGLDDGSAYYWGARMGEAFLHNDFDTDFIPGISNIGERVAAVIGAGNYPPEKTDPLMAMLKTLTSAFGDLSPGLSFDEVMRGCVGPARSQGPAGNAYDLAAAIGAATGQTLIGHFHIDAPHTMRLIDTNPAEDDLHGAVLSGTVDLTNEKGKTTTYDVSGGTFDLLKQDQADVETWLMTYEVNLGEDYHFKGQKTLRRREGSNYFKDVTTLYVDLTPIGDLPPLQGVMTLGLQDLMKQIGTVETGFEGADNLKPLLNQMRKAIKANSFNALVTEGHYLSDFLAMILAMYLKKNKDTLTPEQEKQLGMLLKGSVAGTFAQLIFRTYGGVTAYAYNFPARADVGRTIVSEEGTSLPNVPDVKMKLYPVRTDDGQDLKLYRFKGGTKGPVVMAPGFATTSLSYGMLTTETSILQQMLEAGYDVWLFDYRSGPLTKRASTTPFTLDDIAKYDWPAAIDVILQTRKDDGEGVSDVQALAHCMGSMTLQMSLLGGYLPSERIRNLVLSQLTVHPVTNWFNMMKADAHIARFFVDGLKSPLPEAIGALSGNASMAALAHGLPTINMNSDPDATDGLDPLLNALTWKVPFPYAEPCYSPCCHRIFGVYGPVYAHENMNEPTHNAIKTIFGEVSTTPFLQIGLIMRRGHAVDASGKDVYLPNVDRIKIPTHFIVGALNLEFLPDTSLRTLDWLHESFPDDKGLFTRHVYQGYAHMDCFISKYADNPIYPDIVAEFDRYPVKDS